MKIVFLGTPEFSVPSLEAIAGAGHDIDLVLTQPDRPRGRKSAPAAPPVKRAAQALDLHVQQPESVNEPATVAELHRLRPDVMVVVAFGQILGRKVIEAPKIACLNVHASLLPKYRGAAPVPAAILNGETETGVTVQKVVRKLDAGDILRRRATRIGPGETAGELLKRLSLIGAELLVESLESIAAGTAVFTPQDGSQATYAPMLDKSDGLIDWTRDAEYIERHVRAMSPWPGAFTFLVRDANPLRLLITKASVVPAVEQVDPGLIYEVGQDGFSVAAGSAGVRIERLHPAGKKEMTAAEFARGYRLNAGERLASG